MSTRLKSFIPFVMTALFAGVVLSILSPYGTHGLPMPLRFSYWFGLCLVGGFGVMAADSILRRAGHNAAKPIKAIARSIGSTLGVFIVLVSLMTIMDGLPHPRVALPLLFYIWVIGFTICFVATYVEKDPVQNNRPAIFERLKPALRNAEIYALSAEDHYVRIITSKGDDLVLMRLADAIREAEPLPGLSPHRSWWVGEAGVESVRKSGAKTVIVLKNEIEVPVSRSAQKTVRDAGWV